MYEPAHEKLDVSRRALTLARELETAAANIPPHRADLQDQLRRASSSIVLNLAEGANEFSPRDKARFYRMARRSAAESSAILDLQAQLSGKAIPASLRTDLLVVMESLDKLIHAMQRRRT